MHVVSGVSEVSWTLVAQKQSLALKDKQIITSARLWHKGQKWLQIKGFYKNQCCAITHHLPIVHQGHVINLDNAKVSQSLQWLLSWKPILPTDKKVQRATSKHLGQWSGSGKRKVSISHRNSNTSTTAHCTQLPVISWMGSQIVNWNQGKIQGYRNLKDGWAHHSKRGSVAELKLLWVTKDIWDVPCRSAHIWPYEFIYVWEWLCENTQCVQTILTVWLISVNWVHYYRWVDCTYNILEWYSHSPA